MTLTFMDKYSGAFDKEGILEADIGGTSAKVE